MRLLLEVTQNLVEHARAVGDVTPPSSASSSPALNHAQSFKGRAAETSPSCSTRRANRYFCSPSELRWRREFHSLGLGLMRMCALPTFSGRIWSLHS